MTKQPAAHLATLDDPFAGVIHAAGDEALRRSARYSAIVEASLKRATADALALSGEFAKRPALQAALAKRAARTDAT